MGSATSSTARNSASTIAVAPHTRTPADVETRHVHLAERRPRRAAGLPTARPRPAADCASGTSKSASTSCSASDEDGRAAATPTTGCSRWPLTAMGSGVSWPEHVHVGRHDANLFVRLAQRGRFHRFALVEPPARQRHLAGVVAQRGAPQRERHVPLPVVRIEQQQRRGMAQSVVRHARLGPVAEPGRHAQLGLEPRQRQGQDAPQRAREPNPRFIVRSPGGCLSVGTSQVGQHRPAMGDLPRRTAGTGATGGERRLRQPISRPARTRHRGSGGPGWRRSNVRMVAGMGSLHHQHARRGVTAQVTRPARRPGSAPATAAPESRRRSRGAGTSTGHPPS